MEPAAWLVLATVLSTGQPYSVAWPAPDIVICERARSKVLMPTRSESFCTIEKPVADAYGPPLPPASS